MTVVNIWTKHKFTMYVVRKSDVISGCSRKHNNVVLYTGTKYRIMKNDEDVNYDYSDFRNRKVFIMALYRLDGKNSKFLGTYSCESFDVHSTFCLQKNLMYYAADFF